LGYVKKDEIAENGKNTNTSAAMRIKEFESTIHL